MNNKLPCCEHDSRDRYRTLFETSSDAILIMENDRFVDCNQAAVDMLRYKDKNALLQCHPWELSPEYQPDGQRSTDKARQYLEKINDCRSQRFEWIHVKADGEPLPVEVSMTAIPMDEGYTLHIVWRDISERMRLEKELRHSQKMEALGNLAGGIAHDFNNILMPIVGYSDLLSRSLEEQPRLKGWAQEINRAGVLAKSLVRKLLAVSRKDDNLPVIINLEDTIANTLGMIGTLIGEDVTVHFQRSGSVLQVKTNAGDVEHILLNLASNARDALPTGGQINLVLSRVRESGQSFARIEFSDNGVGMEAATLEQVFTPFFTTKELGSGTGLGLSSVCELVTNAEGKINAKSTPGKGTTIEVLLPLVGNADNDPVDVDCDKTAQPVDIRANGEVQILVVEDDVQVMQIVCELLDKHGFMVCSAGNGYKALEILDEMTPDMVLVDVVMPEMGGPQMINLMHARGIHVPVVFMSGYTDDRLTAQGFDPDDIALIRKPFSEVSLLDRVRQALRADRNWK
ncbi:MAG: response regulator [Gammaproteobacteria bacterium]|nr:response regulator [Gammaproteobacteria bacterium]